MIWVWASMRSDWTCILVPLVRTINSTYWLPTWAWQIFVEKLRWKRQCNETEYKYCMLNFGLFYWTFTAVLTGCGPIHILIKPYYSSPAQCTSAKVSHFSVKWSFLSSLRLWKQTSAQYWLPPSFCIQELSHDAMVIRRSTGQRSERYRNSLTRQDFFTGSYHCFCVSHTSINQCTIFVKISLHIKHENVHRLILL